MWSCLDGATDKTCGMSKLDKYRTKRSRTSISILIGGGSSSISSNSRLLLLLLLLIYLLQHISSVLIVSHVFKFLYQNNLKTIEYRKLGHALLTSALKTDLPAVIICSPVYITLRPVASKFGLFSHSKVQFVVKKIFIFKCSCS